MVQVIQSAFKGILFRSRTEARWAIFFDALGIKYTYEPETFVFPEQACENFADDGYVHEELIYCPDFYLPDLDIFFEVKGLEPKPDEWRKAERLAYVSKKKVFIAVGNPAIHSFGYVVFPTGDCCHLADPETWFGITIDRKHDSFWLNAYYSKNSEFVDRSQAVGIGPHSEPELDSERILKAVSTANNYRFFDY